MGSEQIKIRYANKLEYVGAIKENKPNGQGQLSFKNGSTFQGQFLQGEPKCGKIRNSEYVYEGDLSKLQITGNGMLIDKTNTAYKGLFEKGKLKVGELNKKTKQNQPVFTFKGQVDNLSPFTAKGKMSIFMQEQQSSKFIEQKRTLEGSFKNGNLHGQGKYILSNDDIYSGQFTHGKLQSEGSYQCKQFKITGEFNNNQPNGMNQIAFSNGDIYEGLMKQGQMHGNGKYAFKDGTVYDGDFYLGTMWGQCTITYPKNNEIQKYEGQINQGLYNGIGILYYSNGVIFKGYFLQGSKNGYGVIIYGKEKYKCLYLMNRLSGQLKLIN